MRQQASAIAIGIVLVSEQAKSRPVVEASLKYLALCKGRWRGRERIAVQGEGGEGQLSPVTTARRPVCKHAEHCLCSSKAKQGPAIAEHFAS